MAVQVLLNASWECMRTTIGDGKSYVCFFELESGPATHQCPAWRVWWNFTSCMKGHGIEVITKNTLAFVLALWMGLTNHLLRWAECNGRRMHSLCTWMNDVLEVPRYSISSVESSEQPELKSIIAHSMINGQRATIYGPKLGICPVTKEICKAQQQRTSIPPPIRNDMVTRSTRKQE